MSSLHGTGPLRRKPDKAWDTEESCHAKTFQVSVDGHEYDVAVTEVSDGPGNLYPDRGTMEAARPAMAAAIAPGAPQQAPARPAAGAGDVVSPIAGVVVSVDVALGAKVEATTRVVTLEAMKTKTFISAGRAGAVSAIAVESGDAVEPGQALLTIDT